MVGSSILLVWHNERRMIQFSYRIKAVQVTCRRLRILAQVEKSCSRYGISDMLFHQTPGVCKSKWRPYSLCHLIGSQWSSCKVLEMLMRSCWHVTTCHTLSVWPLYDILRCLIMLVNYIEVVHAFVLYTGMSDYVGKLIGVMHDQWLVPMHWIFWYMLIVTIYADMFGCTLSLPVIHGKPKHKTIF